MFADEFGAELYEVAVLIFESGGKVAVNVEFTDHFAFDEDGNDDLGFRFN